jgi:trans-2,3-dihydro-3-hydroxyanthranilate isomerase
MSESRSEAERARHNNRSESRSEAERARHNNAVERAYRIVDVFTDRAYAGNPLAVVLDGGDLTTEQMQLIAREFNLSETTFPMAPTTGDASYRVRIFTPAAEMPFAGHPSIGTACVLRSLGVVDDGPNVQECGAGLLPVIVAGDRATLTGGPVAVGSAVDAHAALAAVGLTDGDLAAGEPRWAGVGIDFAYLPVQREALGRITPDTSKLLDLVAGSDAANPTGVFVVSYADGEAFARMFAPGLGVAEDPATGSAALGLGVWLATAGLIGSDAETSYVVHQGVEMGRPSRLECVVRTEAATAVETRVTGSVVPVAAGTIRVP